MSHDRVISLPFGDEFDPDAVQRASAATWEDWVRTGRAAAIESADPDADAQFWADVRSRLQSDANQPRATDADQPPTPQEAESDKRPSEPAQITVYLDSNVLEAAQVMAAAATEAIVVIDNVGAVSGLLTSALIIKGLARGANPAVTRVRDFEFEPTSTVPVEAHVADALQVMSRNRIRRVTVTDASRVVAVVTLDQLTRAIHDARSELIEDLIAPAITHTLP